MLSHPGKACQVCGSHIWSVRVLLSIWPLLLYCRNILWGFFFSPVFDKLQKHLTEWQELPLKWSFCVWTNLCWDSWKEPTSIIPSSSLKVWTFYPPFTPISQVWQAWKLETSLQLHSRHETVNVFLENEEHSVCYWRENTTDASLLKEIPLLLIFFFPSEATEFTALLRCWKKTVIN